MRLLIKHNPLAPHQAVIAVTTEIMERYEDGQVSNLPVEKFAKIFTVTGKDQQECKENLTKFMENFNKNQDKNKEL